MVSLVSRGLRQNHQLTNGAIDQQEKDTLLPFQLHTHTHTQNLIDQNLLHKFVGQSLTWNFPPILQRKPQSLDKKINHSKLISHWRHIPVDKLSAKNPSSQAAEFQFWKVSWFWRVCGVRARIASERSGQVSPLFAVGPQPGSPALPFHFPLKCYLPAMPALPACPPVSGPS